MAERIGVLKSYLPSFLVEHRGMYSILSKDIHELSEEECLEMFPAVRLGIELILDEKISELEKQNKIVVGSKALSSLISKYK